MILKLPKRRGFKNKPRKPKTIVLNVGDLTQFSGILDRETLKRSGIVKFRAYDKIKILGEGDVSQPLIVKGLLVSKSAKEKIEKAGGKIEEASVRGQGSRNK